MKRKAKCIVVGMTLLAFLVGFGMVTAENSYAADKRSEEHTSELQSR